METILFAITSERTGRASGYVGGLTLETYQFKGRDIPDGTRVALLTKDGKTLAASTTSGDSAEVSTDTQEVADLLRYQPLGTEAQVFVMLGDEDNILAIIPAKMRKNWLDDSAVHPPAPLPNYWTSEQVQTAISAAIATCAPKVHTHEIADVTGLQDALDGKQDTLTIDSEITEQSTGVPTSTAVRGYVDSIVGDINAALRRL